MIKNKIENGSERKETETYSSGDVIGFCILSIILMLILLAFCFGAFDNPYKELGINENQLAYNLLMETYPEYERCEVKYYNSWAVKEEVDIFCEGKERIIFYFDKNNLQPLDEYFIEQIKEKGIL